MTTTKFEMTATYDMWDASKVQSVRFAAKVESAEVAREIAAQFPKSCKVTGCRVSTGPDRADYGLVNLTIGLGANGSRGEKNETGLKRLASFLRNAEKLGHEIEYVVSFANSYATREEFDAAI